MSRVGSLPGLGPDYTSQYFRGDVVVMRQGHEGKTWTVLRCWADEDLFDMPDDMPRHPMDRALLKGEVGISVLKDGEQLIVPESSVRLYMRDFQRGDIVKRSLTKPESAVVLESKSEVQLQHCFSGQKVDEWISADLLVPSIVFERGDRVIYNNWVGTVEAVIEAGLSLKPDGLQHWMLDPFNFMTVGRKVSQVKQFVLDSGLPEDILACECTHHDDNDRILQTYPLKVMFQWNAINQNLSVHEQKNWPQPPSVIGGTKLVKVKRHLRTSDMPTPLRAVTYLQSIDEYRKRNIRPSEHGESFKYNWAMKITNSRSRLKLLWQDGSVTEDWSTEVVPHERVEDEESWPGEYVLWNGDDGAKRSAVVQSCDPRQRTADLFFPDTQERQTVSALELDPDDGTAHSQVGIDIGTEVLLCKDSGSALPYVAAIGDFAPLPNHTMAWGPPHFQDIAENLQDSFEQEWKANRPDTSDIDWYGRVAALRPDGRVVVELANGLSVTVELKNLYSMHPISSPDELDEMDATSDYSDEGPFGGFGGFGGFGPGSIFPSFLAPALFGPPRPKPARSPSDDSWETTDDEEWADEGSDDEMDVDSHTGEEEPTVPTVDPQVNGTKPVEDEVMSEDARDIEEIDPITASSPVKSPRARAATPDPPASPVSSPEPEAGPSRSNGDLQDDEKWASFDVLESAPPDHHFYGEAPAESSRNRMSRLNKEHKALRTSLPENILVRSYEDRMDLLRVLIIGPEGTPYGGAPFVFDVFLHGNYPFEPPVVHFHSHTNGKGRCNPNLYEDGKVCLSILGTWAGDASESWNASKSSLLQVFVSISGLVLVRNPYHCEPAFAKLEGTREGLINSRQYSEKAYYLSRSFVRQALLHPPSSLADEIRHYYLTAGRLKSVIDHARTLMDKEGEAGDEDGEGGDRWNADAIGSLTMGAKLSLKRVIESLEKIWSEHQASSSNGAA